METKQRTQQRSGKQSRTRLNGNGTVCGRRFCTVCGRWRYLIDFPPRKWLDRHKTVILYVQSECYSCRGASSRESYHLLKPSQRKRRRQSSRTWHRRHRRQNGVPEVGNRVLSDSKIGSVRREPFVVWLKQVIDDHSVAEVAERTRLSERRIHAIVNGYETTAKWAGKKKARKLRPVDYVQLDTVDKALLNWGEHDLLDRLYPLEEPEYGLDSC